LALKGAAHFYRDKGKHLVTVRTEHKATLDTMRELEREGFEVTYLDVLANGLLDLEAFKAALRPDTILVSVMYVNNEIGVIQDIAVIGALCRERGIVFHADAAQATGKVQIDLAKLPVDLMSLASHKTYGPKGIGALYVRRSEELAHASVRMTTGSLTTEEEIDYVVSTLKDRVARLRELTPLWDMFKEGVDLASIQWSAH